jgi:hypothetical protein
MMDRRKSKGLVYAIVRQEQATKVLRLLEKNKGGLTSFQITNLLGEHMKRSLLQSLQKEGKIKQKKGLSPDGRICSLYILSRRD